MENTNLITEEEFGVYYTYAMKQAIRKINSGRRVHLKTLKKLNLLHFLEIEGVKARVIFPKDYTEEEVPTPYPKPVFTKQDVIEFIESYYTNEATKKVYLNRYKKCPDYTSDDLLVPTVDFTAFIDETSIKQVLSPLSQFLKQKYPHQYQGLKDKISNQIKYEIDKEKVKASRKQGNPLVVSVKELEDTYEEYFNNTTPENLTYNVDRTRLLLGLYTEFPLRDDFGKVSFFDNLRHGFNYLDVENKQITILPKKGATERKVYDMSQRLVDMVKDSLNRFPREYLFMSSTPLHPKGNCDKLLTQLFKKVFNKKITINDIRKAYSTNSRLGTVEEEVEMAHTQNHSVNTANTYYQRSA